MGGRGEGAIGKTHRKINLDNGVSSKKVISKNVRKRGTGRKQVS